MRSQRSWCGVVVWGDQNHIVPMVKGQRALEPVALSPHLVQNVVQVGHNAFRLLHLQVQKRAATREINRQQRGGLAYTTAVTPLHQ